VPIDDETDDANIDRLRLRSKSAGTYEGSWRSHVITHPALIAARRATLEAIAQAVIDKAAAADKKAADKVKAANQKIADAAAKQVAQEKKKEAAAAKKVAQEQKNADSTAKRAAAQKLREVKAKERQAKKAAKAAPKAVSKKKSKKPSVAHTKWSERAYTVCVCDKSKDKHTHAYVTGTSPR